MACGFDELENCLDLFSLEADGIKRNSGLSDLYIVAKFYQMMILGEIL